MSTKAAKKRSLTQAQQRVRTAKHALRMIQDERFTPRSRVYLSSDRKLLARDEEKDARTALKNVPCYGCAQGALLLAHIGLHDNMTLSQVGVIWEPGKASRKLELAGDQRTCILGLSDHWDEVQLCLLEHYFEGPGVFSLQACSHDHCGEVSCGQWRDKYPSDRQLLRALLRNVIRNKGTFKPNDLPGV